MNDKPKDGQIESCPKCSKPFPPNTQQCPHCGAYIHKVLAAQPAAPKKKQKIKTSPLRIFYIFATFFAVFLVFRLIGYLPLVYNSFWDNSVSQVEEYFKKELKDPDSLQIIKWGDLEELEDKEKEKVKEKEGYPLLGLWVDMTKYRVRVEYRAKNSFGGYVVKDNYFYLDSLGGVVVSRPAD